ncbi:hypothetical protein NKR23_g706 [Pleurostoma richardsiae]|uniref:Uncharacterized protein n=1 Tax=Pleurostoma richardsiae TaxID=41990 RepID=A0AA38S7L7_9PEZI|nr:hypothetical protein NKR23_g706 [Pleurostoma richardsiae]
MGFIPAVLGVRTPGDCPNGGVYYRCQANGFAGCCYVDRCALPSCPHSAPTAIAEVQTIASTVRPDPSPTVVETAAETWGHDPNDVVTATVTAGLSTATVTAEPSTSGEPLTAATVSAAVITDFTTTELVDPNLVTAGVAEPLPSVSAAALPAKPVTSGAGGPATPVGTIAGIAVGVALGLLLLGIAACLCRGRSSALQGGEVPQDGRKGGNGMDDDPPRSPGLIASSPMPLLSGQARKNPFADVLVQARTQAYRTLDVRSPATPGPTSALVSPMSARSIRSNHNGRASRVSPSPAHPHFELDSTAAPRPGYAELESPTVPFFKLSPPPAPRSSRGSSPVQREGKPVSEEAGTALAPERPRATLSATGLERQRGVHVNSWSAFSG